jgi:putative PEP-CTERM system TPR-repeat lipoprotein
LNLTRPRGIKVTLVGASREQNKIRLSKYLACIAFVGVSLTSIQLAASEKAQPTAYYEDARTRFAKADYKGAIIQLKTILRKSSDNLPARLLLGEAYLAVGDAQSAVKELTRSRLEGADDALVFVPLAKAYLRLGRYQKVLNDIRSGNRALKTEADILYFRGKAHLALDQLDKAQRTLSEAARLRPDSAATLVELARVQIKRRDGEAASELVSAALRGAPEDPDAWFVSGDAKRLRRDLKGAVEDFGKTIVFDPHHLAARLARAGTLIDLNRHEEAEPDILYLRENSPGNPRAIYFHAMLLSHTNKPKEAERALGEASAILESIDKDILEKSPPALLLAGVVAYFKKDLETAHNHLRRHVKIAPRNARSRRLLGTILLRRGDAQGAAKVLWPMLEFAPKDVRALSMLGTALMETKQYSEAAEIFERAAVLAPKNVMIQTNLGVNLLNTGKDNAATDALQRAIDLETGDETAPTLLSLTQMRQGDIKGALKTARAHVERNPENAFAHNIIGSAHAALGKPAEARASYERSMKVGPSYLSPRFNLAELEFRLGNIAESEALYQNILKISGKNARAMIALGRIAESKGDTEQTIRWLEKARVNDPNLVKEQLYLARLYRNAKDPNAALTVLRELVRRNPKNPSALEELALTELATDARERALKSFNRLSALARTLKSTDWLLRSARHLIRLDLTKNATEILKSALKINPKFLPAHAALFDIDVHLGRFEDARRRAKFLQLDYPSNAIGTILMGDLAMRRGRFLEASNTYFLGFKEYRNAALLLRLYKSSRAAGQAKKVINLLEDWIGKHPKDGLVRRAYASALMDVGRNAEAHKLLEAMFKSSPDDSGVLNNLALLHQKNGDTRAISFAEKAYESAPKQAGIIDTYGWILVQNGQAAKGLELLRNAQARAPKIAEIRYHIAVALHQLGRDEDALRDLEAVLTAEESFEGRAEAHALWLNLSGG